MRTILSTSLLALVAALSISACSSSSNSSANSADPTANSAAPADNSMAGNSAASSDNTAASSDNGSAMSDNTASSATPAGSAPASGDAPVYPGAVEGSKPAGLADKAPASVKAYSTSDDFAKVKAWYQAQLKGTPEMASPGKEKTMDVFLVGQGDSRKVVMIQNFKGNTWILIGPPGN